MRVYGAVCLVAARTGMDNRFSQSGLAEFVIALATRESPARRLADGHSGYL
jgi:hypothetical protein